MVERHDEPSAAPTLGVAAVKRKTALILDFGGVISRTLFETHDESERVLGLAPGTLDWRGPFDPDNDPLWRAMQRRELTERGYWRKRVSQVGALSRQSFPDVQAFVRRVRRRSG